MRRALLISLSLVLALVGWTTVCADDGFYVISGHERKICPGSQDRSDGILCRGRRRGFAEGRGLAHPALYRQWQWHRH